MWLCFTECLFVWMDRLGEEMAGCFKWYEAHYPRWLHPNKDSQSEVSPTNSVHDSTTP